MIHPISDKSSIVTNGKSGLFLTVIGGRDQAHTPVSGWYDTSEAIYPEYYPWGFRDDKLNTMHKLMTENDKSLQLIRTNVKYMIGAGVVPMRRIVEDRKVIYEPYESDQVKEWMERAQIQKYAREAAWQWSYCWNTFTNISSDKAGEFWKPKVRDAFVTRIGRIPKGKYDVQKFLLSDMFGTPMSRTAKKFEVPAFDPANPARFTDAIMHEKEPIPGQPFYAFPGWWGGEKWLKVSNLIPLFHESGLTNGYNIKYKIGIPVDYFIQQGITDEAEQRAAYVQLRNEMDQWLSGVKNVNKAIITRYFLGPDGKAVAGLTIEPIDNKMSDDAYTKIASTADIAHSSSHGIMPVLAGIDTGSKLGGSGSEIRLAYEYTKMMVAADRHPMIQPIKVCAKLSGLPSDIEFQISDTEFTTLDKNPTGKQNSSTVVEN
jgi:hypothetical protein